MNTNHDAIGLIPVSTGSDGLYLAAPFTHNPGQIIGNVEVLQGI